MTGQPGGSLRVVSYGGGVQSTALLFARSCELEDLLNRRMAALGRDPVYLTRFGAPLAQVIGTAQERLFDHDPGCDSGWCMT